MLLRFSYRASTISTGYKPPRPGSTAVVSSAATWYNCSRSCLWCNTGQRILSLHAFSLHLATFSMLQYNEENRARRFYDNREKRKGERLDLYTGNHRENFNAFATLSHSSPPPDMQHSIPHIFQYGSMTLSNRAPVYTLQWVHLGENDSVAVLATGFGRSRSTH